MDNKVPALSSGYRHMFSVQFVGAAITGTSRNMIFFSCSRLCPDMSLCPVTFHCYSSSLNRQVAKSPGVSCVASNFVQGATNQKYITKNFSVEQTYYHSVRKISPKINKRLKY